MSLARPTRRQVVTAVPGAAGLALLVAACGSGELGWRREHDAGGRRWRRHAAAVGGPGRLRRRGQGSSGRPVVVARPAQDHVVAFSAICTHMGCTVAPAGATLKCPCHGSAFDANTGAVINGPAAQPLPSVAVRVDGGSVVIG